jgi:hypothetical protein
MRIVIAIPLRGRSNLYDRDRFVLRRDVGVLAMTECVIAD